MKSIDFSQPGGFPLTQDQLNHLQSAYKETTLALARVGGYDNGPFAVSGVDVTNPAPGEYSTTEGWFLYNNDLVHIPMSGISGIAAGNDAYVQIESNNNSVTYNDGVVREVVLDNFGMLVSLPVSTPDDATKFRLTNLRRFGVGLGLANRESSWNTLVVNTDPAVGGVTGTVYYKKNFLTNTLQIRGSLNANNAQNFAASPGSIFYSMGVLPSGYFPANTTYFIAQYFVGSSLEDSAGVSWIKQVNCLINTTGQFLINWIKPTVGVGGYGLTFNTVVSLD